MLVWFACTILPSLATTTACTRTERAWLQHCAVADDCTSEASFCSCCGAYPNTEYADACEVICGMRVVHARSRSAAAAHSSWDFEDFGDRSSTSVRERGPTFEQPALSLIGDAAVVLGDCYNLDVRARATADTHAEIVAGEDGQEACLIPPVTPRLFSTDAHLALNLSVCPSRVAPFHVRARSLQGAQQGMEGGAHGGARHGRQGAHGSQGVEAHGSHRGARARQE
jgi:hypothetical protein